MQELRDDEGPKFVGDTENNGASNDQEQSNVPRHTPIPEVVHVPSTKGLIKSASGLTILMLLRSSRAARKSDMANAAVRKEVDSWTSIYD